MRRVLPVYDGCVNELAGGARQRGGCGETGWRALAASLLVAVGATAQVGPIVYVDDSATGAADGTSWTDAFVDLNDGLAAASLHGEAEVWIAEGVYRPDGGTLERDRSFVVPSGSRLYGGFVGDEQLLISRDPERCVTLLSGDLRGDDDLGGIDDNSHHIIVIDEPFGIQSFIDGLTIRGGSAHGAPEPRGAGMLIRAGGVSVDHVRFENNHAVDGGAVFVTTAGAGGFTRCVFLANEASGSGGAMAAADVAFPTVIGSRFHGNIAQLHGGALASVEKGAFAILNSIFTGNVAVSGRGGAVAASDGDLVMHGTTVVDNAAGNGADALSFGTALFQLTGSAIWGPDGGVALFENVGGAGFLLADVNAIKGWDSLPYPTGTTIDTEPLFVDVDGDDDVLGTEDDDVRLRPTSPLIDAGAYGPGTTFDVNGRSRLLDGTLDGELRVDIGAHEHTHVVLRTVNRVAPGSTLTLDVRADALLDVTLLASPAGGSLFDWTYGAVLLDLPSLIIFEPLGGQRTVSYDIPLGIEPMAMHFQLFAGIEGRDIGNGSNAVVVAIE